MMISFVLSFLFVFVDFLNDVEDIMVLELDVPLALKAFVGSFVGNVSVTDFVMAFIAFFAYKLTRQQARFNCANKAVQLSIEKKKYTVKFLDEWRTRDMLSARERLGAYLKSVAEQREDDMQKGFRKLDQGIQRDMRTISYFFDYVGNCMQQDLLDRDLYFVMMARPTTKYWNDLKGYVEQERYYIKTNDNPAYNYEEVYQSGFSWLAKEAAAARIKDPKV